MPASLGTLPPESLDHIINNIGKSGWLLDVALTCRSLHDLALSHLYTDVKLIYHGWERPYPYLRSFTMHVLQYPQLAGHVRTFAMHERYCSREDPCGECEPTGILPDEVKEVVHRFSHTTEEATEWIDDLQKACDDDAFLGLLLPSLPNLERLQLLVPELYCFEKYFDKMITKRIPQRLKPFDAYPAFSKLQVMISDCDAQKYGTSPDLLSSFLKLPSLREFYGRRIGGPEDSNHEGLAQLASGISKLTHLEMRDSKIHASDMTNLLRVCSGVKTLVYEFGGGHLSFCEHSIPALRRALDLVANTLENLWLDAPPGCLYWMEFDDYSPIPSLATFNVLKNLKVGVFVLLGEANPGMGMGRGSLDNTEAVFEETNLVNLANVLPASLETIYISQTNGKIRMLTKALEYLLEQKQSAVPKLQRITFEAYITGNDEKFDFVRLDRLAKENGVIVNRIDGTALAADNGIGWEYSPGIIERGQGMDGSLTWAAECAPIRDQGPASVPIFIKTPQ